MEILSFNISGKLAHFRKYYANNTAFSFTIPPRTSLMGIVAAVMGWQRDSYYDRLSSEHLRFGIRVLSPLKKSFHRLNLLSIKSLGDMSKKMHSDFRGEGGRIQTPHEVVSGWDIRKDEVQYQVFISSNGSGEKTFQLLKDHFISQQPVFNVVLGTANFSASLSGISIIGSEQIVEKKSDDYVLVSSAIPSPLVEDLNFDKDDFDNYNFVEEDMLPGDFISDGNREVKRMNRLLFSTTPNPLRVRLCCSYYQVNLNGESINMLFMDS